MPKLNEKQEKALSELMIGKTRAEVAAACDVAESTIYAWLNDLTFRTRLKELQRAVFNETTAQLHGLASLAIETLRRGLNNEASAVEIRTAIAVIERTAKLHDSDIEERLEALENALLERNL